MGNKFTEGMKVLGKGIADWAESAPPTALKLENIGKPVEVRTWVREEQGVNNDSMMVYVGVLESFTIGRVGMSVSLVGVPSININRNNYRIEVRVA